MENRNKQQVMGIYELLWQDKDEGIPDEVPQEFKERVRVVVSKLSPLEREYVHLGYGDDFDNPVRSKKWDEVISRNFYSYVVPKMQRMLATPEYSKWNRDNLEDKLANKKESMQVNLLFSIDKDNFDEIAYLFTEEEQMIIKFITDMSGRYFNLRSIAKKMNKPLSVIVRSVRSIIIKYQEYIDMNKKENIIR